MKMTSFEAIGFILNQTSSITALCGASTQSRIFHGSRPGASGLSALPCLNYYEMGGMSRKNGLGSQTFTINCRDTTAGGARNLANKVIDLFHGSSGTGVYGTFTNGAETFDVARSSLVNDSGLIEEPDSDCYNVPLDVLFVYALDTVS